MKAARRSLPRRMLRPLNPPSIRAPFARYSHGVEVPPGMRVVFCSGQLGVAAEDQIPETVEAQAELCFDNIRAILAETGLDLSHLVRINAFVTRREDMPAYMAVRDRLVDDPPP